MPPTSSVRQLLADRAVHIAALAIAGLLAPLGACGGATSRGNGAGGGGAGGNGAGGYGEGGAQQCAKSHDFSAVGVTLSNGYTVACVNDGAVAATMVTTGSFGGSPDDVTVEGVVRNVTSGTFVVDSCHPNGNCAPTESVVTLSGTDLSVSIPDGTFVQMRLYREFVLVGSKCHVTVRNIPSWGSTPNPTSDGTFLWLAHHFAGDADYSVPHDPYQIKAEVVCEQPFRLYAFRFSFTDAPGAEVVAPQGQTVTWSVPVGEHAGEYRVRNVKAEWDNHFVYQYWIARK